MIFFRQLFCQHKTGSLTKREGDRVFIECMDCGKQSKGVLMPLKRRARRKAGTRIDITVMHTGPVPVFIPKRQA